jgi:hypothetical protein
MQALVDLIAGLGFAGSIALLAWGMALCLRYGYRIDTAVLARIA